MLVGRCTYVGALHALAILALLYMLLGAFFVMLEHCWAHHLPFIQALFSSLGNFTAHLLSRAKKTFEMADVFLKPRRTIYSLAFECFFKGKSIHFATKKP